MADTDWQGQASLQKSKGLCQGMAAHGTRMGGHKPASSQSVPTLVLTPLSVLISLCGTAAVYSGIDCHNVVPSPSMCVIQQLQWPWRYHNKAT
jgi:hypothetical protein